MIESKARLIPYFIKVGGREYKLCLKRDHSIGATTYFFTDIKAPIPEGAEQASLPSHYEVVTDRGFPILRKKNSTKT